MIFTHAQGIDGSGKRELVSVGVTYPSAPGACRSETLFRAGSTSTQTTKREPMCDHLSQVGHAEVEEALRVAKDSSTSSVERQTSCWAAMNAGIYPVPRPPSVEPTPFCRRLDEVRDQAHKLWVEELSPQAQRERYRQAQAATIGELEPGELRGAEATEYIATHLRRVSGDANTLVTNYVDRLTGEHWVMDLPFGDSHHRGRPRLRKRTGST